MWIPLRGTKTILNVSFYVYVSPIENADTDSCSTLAAFILTLEKNEPKI